jgi:hypothetical protein
MATYADKYTALPFTGKNVAVLFGVIHEAVALGTQTGTENKDFVFTPATYGPFYPRESYAKDFVSTKDDVTVYDDGVEATISSWTPTTGTATLSAAPEDKSVMTGDCVEQRELFIAQNATLKPKRDTEDLDQLRNSTTRKTYGNTEWTLTADYKVGSADIMKLIFQPVTGHAGRYEYPEEPPLVYCAVIIESTTAGVTTIEQIYYCEDVRADFGDMLKATAGKKAVENGLELTFGTAPIMIIPSEVT